MGLRMRKSKVMPPHEACPIGTCLELLGGAWGPNVIWYLSEGPRRFSELQADMRPISAKVLSVRLKELERRGVVRRQVHDIPPVRPVIATASGAPGTGRTAQAKGSTAPAPE